jgi:hypothetical protein
MLINQDLISLHKAIEKRLTSITTDIAYLKICLNNLLRQALVPPRHKLIAVLNPYPYKSIFSSQEGLKQQIHYTLEQAANNIKCLTHIFQNLLETPKPSRIKQARQERLSKIETTINVKLTDFITLYNTSSYIDNIENYTQHLNDTLTIFVKAHTALENGYQILAKEIIKSIPSFVPCLSSSTNPERYFSCDRPA